MLAMTVIAACDKNGSPEPEGATNGRVECRFSLGGSAEVSYETRSVGLESGTLSLADEKKVNTLTVFIFSRDGKIADTGSADGNMVKINLKADSGYDFFAVANAGTDWSSSVTSANELKEITSSALSGEDALCNFVMTGSLLSETVDRDHCTFTIDVTRRAAKVVVRKITNSLNEAAGDISLEGIYLSNVITNCNLFGTALPETPAWANKFGAWADVPLQRAWFGDALTEGPVRIANGKSYETAHTFYAAANPIETDCSGEKEFTPRKTRLVIKAEIQGDDYYYPLTFNTDRLPALEAGKCIDIENIDIRHLGSSSPESPVSTVDVSFEVRVLDWDRMDAPVEI
mgnify:CR=1 FL=1